MEISRSALDNYITGHWGEDQFRGMDMDDSALYDENGNLVGCSNCDAEATELQDGKPFCYDCGYDYEKAGPDPDPSPYLGDDSQDPFVRLELIDYDREESDEDRERDYYERGGDDDEEAFADPGGVSALRAETPSNPRNLPCPNCGEPNRLTPADRRRSYVCDSCADLAERGF